jgi:hypothetical protein
VTVLLWADDIIITDNSDSIVQPNVEKISNLGEIDLLRYRVNHTLELTQVPYLKSVIAKLGPNLIATNAPLNPYHDYRAKNEGEVIHNYMANSEVYNIFQIEKNDVTTPFEPSINRSTKSHTGAKRRCQTRNQISYWLALLLREA